MFLDRDLVDDLHQAVHEVRPSHADPDESIRPVDPSEKQDALKRAARMEWLATNGIAIVPDRKNTGVFVRFQREMRQWKRETLASFATVSLSTIERVERGDPVSNVSLDRVAIALGYKVGDFTEARVPLSATDANARLKEWLKPFGGQRWIDVSPIRKQQQIAAFGDCDTYLIDNSRLTVNVSDHLVNLHEWLNFVACIRDNSLGIQTDRKRREVARRRLYVSVLAHIQEMERIFHSVALGGVYTAETDLKYLPKASVAVIGFFPKMTDPAANKRGQLLVPERFALSKSSPVDDAVS